jgi:hypothetical protein
MKTAGVEATKQARATLAAAGVGAVVERNGILLEILPDGSVRRLDPGEIPGDG